MRNLDQETGFGFAGGLIARDIRRRDRGALVFKE